MLDSVKVDSVEVVVIVTSSEASSNRTLPWNQLTIGSGLPSYTQVILTVVVLGLTILVGAMDDMRGGSRGREIQYM